MGADKRVPHNPLELEKLLELASKAQSLLEIGSRYGGTLRLMAEAMGKGRIVAVDLPGVRPWGEPDSEQELKANVETLKAEGFDAHLFIGDSTDPDVVNAVNDLGQFDMVFIDGDHRYDGAKADWLNYGPMGKVVVFHDIVRPSNGIGVEVWRLWSEIQGNKSEFIAPGSSMGLGIVNR